MEPIPLALRHLPTRLRIPADRRIDAPVARHWAGFGEAGYGQGDTLQGWIAVAAYFKAERRGFHPGHELADWLEAEQDILARLDGY